MAGLAFIRIATLVKGHTEKEELITRWFCLHEWRIVIRGGQEPQWCTFPTPHPTPPLHSPLTRWCMLLFAISSNHSRSSNFPPLPPPAATHSKAVLQKSLSCLIVWVGSCCRRRRREACAPARTRQMHKKDWSVHWLVIGECSQVGVRERNMWHHRCCADEVAQAFELRFMPISNCEQLMNNGSWKKECRTLESQWKKAAETNTSY